MRGDGPLMTGLFGPEAMFAFDWRLALGTSPLSDAEMASLAAATTPIIRLRDNWVVIDPALARKARKRVSTGSTTGTWKPVAPVAALRASLTGVLDIGGEEIRVHPGASLLKVRDRVVDAVHRRPARPAARAGGDAPRLPAPGPDLAGRDDRRSGSAAASPTTWDWARPSP